MCVDAVGIEKRHPDDGEIVRKLCLHFFSLDFPFWVEQKGGYNAGQQKQIALLDKDISIQGLSTTVSFYIPSNRTLKRCCKRRDGDCYKIEELKNKKMKRMTK